MYQLVLASRVCDLLPDIDRRDEPTFRLPPSARPPMQEGYKQGDEMRNARQMQLYAYSSTAYHSMHIIIYYESYMYTVYERTLLRVVVCIE